MIWFKTWKSTSMKSENRSMVKKIKKKKIKRKMIHGFLTLIILCVLGIVTPTIIGGADGPTSIFIAHNVSNYPVYFLIIVIIMILTYLYIWRKRNR